MHTPIPYGIIMASIFYRSRRKHWQVIEIKATRMKEEKEKKKKFSYTTGNIYEV